MGERGFLAAWCPLILTLSCVLGTSLVRSIHATKGCNHHIDKESVAVDFNYSCVYGREDQVYAVFYLTIRPGKINETEHWLKIWKKGLGSKGPRYRGPFNMTQGKVSVYADTESVHYADSWLVWVVHGHQKTQVSHCVTMSCSRRCKWEEKMLSQLRDCKDCVITSLVSTKVNDRNEVMASFCTFWKQYPVGAQIQIRTAPVRNNLHCNMSEKRYPLKQYTRVPVAVQRESCANCSESLGMRCVTGKRKIKVEVEIVLPKTTAQPGQITTTIQPVMTSTTGYPSIAQDHLVTHIPSTVQIPSTNQVPFTGQVPFTDKPENNSSNSLMGENVLPATIGLCFAVTLILVLIFVIAKAVLKVVKNHDRTQEMGETKKADSDSKETEIEIKYGYTLSGNSANVRNNRVRNNNPNVVELGSDMYKLDDDNLHSAVVIYHAGNKEKAKFSRKVIVEGLRQMNIDCTSPEFEKIHGIGISRWVKNTLDSVDAVVAVCCDEFYKAFWAQNQPRDEESAIVFEFSQQLKSNDHPRFISVIAERDERKYVPDRFRDDSSIICLQSLHDFCDLVSSLAYVGKAKNESDWFSTSGAGRGDYMLQMEETWDRVCRNIKAFSH